MTRFLLDVRFARPAALDGVGRFLWSAAAAVPAALAPGESLTLLCLDDDAAAWARHVPRAQLRATDVPIASLLQHARYRALTSGVDVVHYPQFDVPLVDAPVVSCIYDLTMVDEPTYFGAGRSLRRVAAAALLAGGVARAARVVTLSHASRLAIAGRFDAGDRVRVVEPGPPLTTTPTATNSTTTPAPWSFAYVGNHRPHKRVELLLRAFRRLRQRRPEARLSLFGRSDPRFPAVPRMVAGEFGDGVDLVEGASDDDIAARVAGVSALVFASVGEGYGFPVVEAFAAGTPAIVSDKGSLAEVAGAGGVVVAADDEDAWLAAMERVGGDAVLRERLAQGARHVVSALDHDRAARQLLAVWREALR